MSKTSLVARQVRLQQWAEDIRSCSQRPEGTTVSEWCAEHGLNKATYYWRLGAVRKACIDIVDPISDNDVCDQTEHCDFVEISHLQDNACRLPPAVIRLGNASVEINNDISDALLLRIMEAAYHVK